MNPVTATANSWQLIHDTDTWLAVSVAASQFKDQPAAFCHGISISIFPSLTTQPGIDTTVGRPHWLRSATLSIRGQQPEQRVSPSAPQLGRFRLTVPDYEPFVDRLDILPHVHARWRGERQHGWQRRRGSNLLCWL